MAVGAVSSAHSLQNLGAALGTGQQQEQQVLRSGESVTTTAAALKDPKAKVYRHMLPGANFIMPDGLEIKFLGGQFATSDPEIIKQLDAVANKTASMIYTEVVVAENIKQGQKAAAADAAETAGKTAA